MNQLPSREHGGTRPNPPSELRSPVLRAFGGAIAEACVSRIYATWPDLLDRYGERGREFTTEDNFWHLNFLDAAVALDDPRAFPSVCDLAGRVLRPAWTWAGACRRGLPILGRWAGGRGGAARAGRPAQGVYRDSRGNAGTDTRRSRRSPCRCGVPGRRDLCLDLLLYFHMEAGRVQRADQFGGLVVAGDLERFFFGLGGVARNARDLLDGGLDRFVAGPAAVVDAGHGQARYLALGRTAVAREMHRLGLEVTVVARGGQGLDAFLGRGVIGSRDGHSLGLLVADARDPFDALQARKRRL